MKSKLSIVVLLVSLMPACGRAGPAAAPIYRQASCLPVGTVSFAPDYGHGSEDGSQARRIFSIELIDDTVRITTEYIEFATPFDHAQLILKAGEVDKEGLVSIEVTHGRQSRTIDFGIIQRDCWDELESKYRSHVKFERVGS